MASSVAGLAVRPGRMKVPRAFVGFTLIELIVTFAVVALFLGLAPVAFGKLMDASHYRSTVRQMLAGMVSARQQSITSGRSTAFSVDLEHRLYGVEGKVNNSLPESIQVRLVVAGVESAQQGGSIRFYPGGGATGGSVDVLRASGEGVRLRVDWLLGSVSQEPVGR